MKFEIGDSYVIPKEISLFSISVPINSLLKIVSSSPLSSKFLCEVYFIEAVLPTLCGFLNEAQLEYMFKMGQIIINKNLDIKLKDNRYCNCTESDRVHNIGAGTLDFYVCKKCKKEIK